MPLYRVDLRDGDNHLVKALRVVERGDEYTFQDPRGPGAWETSFRVPAQQVRAITRRVTEQNGSFRWVTESPREQPPVSNSLEP